MPIIYVARSAALTKWASDVGLGKHLFKVGFADDKAAAETAIAAGWAGEADWRLVAARELEAPPEEPFVRLGRKEKAVDPFYYPRLKGAEGIFRVTLLNVANAMLVAQAMQSPDQPLEPPKPKPKDIAEYLIRNAVG